MSIVLMVIVSSLLAGLALAARHGWPLPAVATAAAVAAWLLMHFLRWRSSLRPPAGQGAAVRDC